MSSIQHRMITYEAPPPYMAMSPAPAKPRSTFERLDSPIASRVIIACAALLSLAPFLLNLSRFRELFFFGDDWDRLSQMADLGLLRWSVLPFAESFQPLSKIFWGGAVILFQGSYFSLLLLLWLTHLAIIAAIGSILRSLGFGVSAVLFAMLSCALPWTNMESLGWSEQWSQLLATLFFLLAWRVLISLLHIKEWTGLVGFKIALYGLLLLASALSFARGVVAGLVLGVFIAFSPRLNRPAVVLRSGLAISLVIPAILLTLMYAPMFARPHAQPAQSHYIEMAAFGSGALLLNPLFLIAGWQQAQVARSAALVFGLFKASIILGGFAVVRRSPGKMAFLGALVLDDVINCALLGVGRFHTGIQAAVSSRYQYVSLLCLAPFLGILIERLLAGFRSRLAWTAATALLLAWCGLLVYAWPGNMKIWSAWRGTDIRNAIRNSDPAREAFAASTQRARRAQQLVAKYNLH